MWDDLPGHVSDVEHGLLSNDVRLQASYARCEAARVDRARSGCEPGLHGKSLQTFFGRHGALCAYTRLLFAEIHRHLADPTELLLLTDAECRIIDMCSHPGVLHCAATRYGIRPGATLNEANCGTNAVALALHDHEDSIVCGPQHYCRMFNDWCMVAIPVPDVDSRVCSCVAICASVRRGIGERLALAKCMSREVGAFFRTMAADGPVHDYAAGASNGSARRAPFALTNRQHEVLILFARGFSYKQIAHRLGIHSVKTVEEHLDAVRSKLGATCRRECIRKAGEAGLLDS
jgi:transcriptional regulator of acetoin/glycerol metabolism